MMDKEREGVKTLGPEMERCANDMVFTSFNKAPRVLHVLKTSDGAEWAALQVTELVRSGIEVHVVLPSAAGRMLPLWQESGATIHTAVIDWTVQTVAAWPKVKRAISTLVGDLKPDLIHSHFLSSTVLLRRALGVKSRIPRLFQVPGPLHLEYDILRRAELMTAGPLDCWIASSRCILNHYQTAGVPENRLFLSYYGTNVNTFHTERTGYLRRKLRLDDHTIIVGNANYIYPPRRYLGQKVGLKCHEDIIDALGTVIQQKDDVVGVLIGGTFAGSGEYERQLRARAAAVGGDRIIMTGYMPGAEVRQAWSDFDLAIHVPLSENCGGVLEPMLSGVPVIAGQVGGLPEIVMEGVSGSTVPIQRPDLLARCILDVLASPDRYQVYARNGQRLARQMFSVERTAREIFQIYQFILGRANCAPPRFDARTWKDGE